MMQNKLFDLQRLISFRREIHQFPEIAFEEFKTAERIIKYLNDLGIDQKSIRRIAKTGIVVDVKGKGPSSGNSKTIAIRADMDALPMKEDNSHLEYQSTNDNAAHMCGHDGHVTCLLGGLSKILEHWHQIPENKCVRLLFQPAEESLESGAKLMVEEGCLEGVEEVYGMHNFPTYPIGTIVVKSGPMMAQSVHIKITFIGKGGHGSQPEKANDPLQPALEFHAKLKELNQKYKDEGKTYVCTFPVLQVGEAINVIAEKAFLGGTLRSFDNDFAVEFRDKLQQIVDEICEKYKCKSDFSFRFGAPVVINAEKETGHVRKIACKLYGEDNVTEEGVPVYASEDFSYFSNKIPGAFFFVGIWEKTKQPIMSPLHNLHYNFNDDIIGKASEFWFRLVEDRFEIQFE